MSHADKNSSRLVAALEQGNYTDDICAEMGPEGFAVLDTVRAAVHARRMSLADEAAVWRALEEGPSLAATVLREYRTTPNLLTFGAAMAQQLLPRNAVLDFERERRDAPPLEGGASLASRFKAAMKDRASLKKASKKVKKLHAKKTRMEDDLLNKGACMALCKKTRFWESRKHRTEHCGGSGPEERCGNMVGEHVREVGMVYNNDAGMHIDTKSFRDPNFLEKMKGFAKSWFWKTFADTDTDDQYFGVGAWATKHLVAGWEQIDNGVMHVCHYHADKIRNSNRAQWAILVAARMSQVVIAMTLVSFVQHMTAERDFSEALKDGKLDAVEIRRLNKHLENVTPATRQRFLERLTSANNPIAYMAGKGGDVFVEDGKILAESAARAATAAGKIQTLYLSGKSIISPELLDKINKPTRSFPTSPENIVLKADPSNGITVSTGEKRDPNSIVFLKGISKKTPYKRSAKRKAGEKLFGGGIGSNVEEVQIPDGTTAIGRSDRALF